SQPIPNDTRLNYDPPRHPCVHFPHGAVVRLMARSASFASRLSLRSLSWAASCRAVPTGGGSALRPSHPNALAARKRASPPRSNWTADLPATPSAPTPVTVALLPLKIFRSLLVSMSRSTSTVLSGALVSR